MKGGAIVDADGTFRGIKDGAVSNEPPKLPKAPEKPDNSAVTPVTPVQPTKSITDNS